MILPSVINAADLAAVLSVLFEVEHAVSVNEASNAIKNIFLNLIIGPFCLIRSLYKKVFLVKNFSIHDLIKNVFLMNWRI